MEGTFGTTGKRWLKRSGEMLESGKEEIYTFDGLDVGDVKKVCSPEVAKFRTSVSFLFFQFCTIKTNSKYKLNCI